LLIVAAVLALAAGGSLAAADSAVLGAAIVATRDGSVYRMGGYDPAQGALTQVERFDRVTEQWTRRASMPRPRYGHAVVQAANGCIYALGGYYDAGLAYLDHEMTYPAEVDEYDPVADTWRVRGALALPRAHLAAVARGASIFVIGGHRPGRGVVGTVEQYDPNANVWTRRADMPSPRIGLIATVAADGRIFALAGLGRPDESPALDVYDPVADRWESPIGS
jgi:N-acetylneuraminic acid mutarotase